LPLDIKNVGRQANDSYMSEYNGKTNNYSVMEKAKGKAEEEIGKILNSIPYSICNLAVPTILNNRCN